MARKLAKDTKIGAAPRLAAAVSRCSPVSRYSPSRLPLIPVCHQNSNDLKLTQRAQGRHIPVQNLCVLGILCGYDNKMSRKLAKDTKIGAAPRLAAAVSRCSPVSRYSPSRLPLIPVCHQNSNELKLTQRAQGRHIPVQNLCVLGVLCGYSNPEFVVVPPSGGWERVPKNQFTTTLGLLYDNKSVSIGGQVFGNGA
jgi:hypothetical protein